LLKLILLDVTISMLDIAFLAALLFVIRFYTEPASARTLPRLFDRYPLLLIGGFFTLFSIKNLFGFLIFQLQSKFTYGVATRLSKNNLENYLDGSYADYVNVDSSVYTRKISQQPIEFCYYILGGFQQIIGQSLLIFITLLAILSYNAVLFPLLFAILTPPVLIIGLVQKKRLAAVRNNAKTVRRKTIQHLQEALSGFVESNVFQRKQFFVNRYHSSQKEFNQFLSTQQVIQHLPVRLIEVFAVFGLFMLILLNHSFSPSQSMPFITLGAFMAAAYKIIPGIVKILNTTGQMKTYGYTMDDLLKEKKEEPLSATRHAGIQKIELKNLSFGYPGKNIIDDFSLEMKPGDFIGVSGRSGRGKTTLLHLLIGFVKPSSGSVLVNGKKLEEADLKQHWDRISYIKQQPFFIHDTAVTNVVLADGHYDRQRFETASSVAGFKTFINGDASRLIRENGKNISGGQRQRIAFARSLYKEFDLLFLDEPFSEMDTDSEMKMVKLLQELAGQGKIIVLVTHNKDSLRYCSKIIQLDHE
jgi:ABC-type bacteriocin/lantibiotic exporter with double-glycine peptidase domain